MLSFSVILLYAIIQNVILTDSDDRETQETAETHFSQSHKHNRDSTGTHSGRKVTKVAGHFHTKSGSEENNVHTVRTENQTEIKEKHKLKATDLEDDTSRTIVTRSLKRKIVRNVSNKISEHEKGSVINLELPKENKTAKQNLSKKVKCKNSQGNSEIKDVNSVPSLKLKLPKKRKSENRRSKVNAKTEIHVDSNSAETVTEHINVEYKQPVGCNKSKNSRNDAKYSADISYTEQTDEKPDNNNNGTTHNITTDNHLMKDILTWSDDFHGEDESLTELAKNSLVSLPEKLAAKASKAKKVKKETSENVSMIPNVSTTKVCKKDYLKDDYHCNECGVTFKYHMAFTKHKKDGACVFLCSYCGKRYTARYYSNFLLHVKYHTNDRQHVCSQCGKAFAEKSKLTTHLRSHSNERLFVCDVCGQAFKTNTILRCHIKYLHTERPKDFSCEICDRRFVSIYNLNTHQNVTHSSVRPFECEICGKSFKTRYALEKNHMPCHQENGQLFSCYLCPKSFKKKEYLNLHLKRHKNERTHFCETCDKGFFDNKTLREHSRIHSGEKPYSCAICEYKCALKGNLTKHMKVHANEEEDESDTGDSDDLEREIGIQESDIRNSVLNMKKGFDPNELVIPDLNASAEVDCRGVEKTNRNPVFNQRQNFRQDSYSVLSLLNRDVSNSGLQNTGSVIITDISKCQDMTGSGKEVSKTENGMSRLQNDVLRPDNETSGPENELSNSLMMLSGLFRHDSNLQYQDNPGAPSIDGPFYPTLEPSIPQNDLNYMQYGSSIEIMTNPFLSN